MKVDRHQNGHKTVQRSQQLFEGSDRRIRSDNSAPPETEERILRYDEITEITGLSRTTIWRYVRAGLFPPPRCLGPNSVGWLASEIASWMASRPVPNYVR